MIPGWANSGKSLPKGIKAPRRPKAIGRWVRIAEQSEKRSAYLTYSLQSPALGFRIVPAERQKLAETRVNGKELSNFLRVPLQHQDGQNAVSPQ
jgi:hypothetical protein